MEPARKTKSINIRISEAELARLKRRAQDEGVPYQTLVSSELHRYVSDRLVDEKQMLKSLELLRSKQGARRCSRRRDRRRAGRTPVAR